MRKFMLGFGAAILMVMCVAWDKPDAAPAYAQQASKVARELTIEDIAQIKVFLSDARVDQITTIAEYRTYQKRMNRLMRILLKQYVEGVE